MHWDLVIIGGGAAGLLAAARAAEGGCRTLLLEKNRKPGVKILMSGGTRCNLTHDTDARGIIAAFGRQGRFLHSALAALGPRELVQLFEAEGVATKIEATGKVFPVSDRAVDVVQALLRRLNRSGAQLALADPLKNLEFDAATGHFRLFTSQSAFTADRVLVTSGGQSYAGCGTTGDGYVWARALGHTIVPPRPALTPVTTAAAWVHELSGVTVPDVGLKLVERPGNGAVTSAQGLPRPLDQRRGSFLFTHFGLSGPAPMDISRAITGHLSPEQLDLLCDFLPDVTTDRLASEVDIEFSSGGKRQLGNVLGKWLPGRLALALIAQAGLPADQRVAEIGKRDRSRLVGWMKGAVVSVTGTRGFAKAEVTAGGVSLDEVDSRTLQSKKVPGLYFAGEVLDLDGPIGGYNFQSAFSTGWLAGQSVAAAAAG